MSSFAKRQSGGRSGRAAACSTAVYHESPLDEFVRDRAGQSLAHVFTLLSLVLPSQPLQIAFRSLHSENSRLRGTALEYLEGVLPPKVRDRLWPFLVEGRTTAPSQPHDEVMANLLRSSSSVTLHGVAGVELSAPALPATQLLPLTPLLSPPLPAYHLTHPRCGVCRPLAR